MRRRRASLWLLPLVLMWTGPGDVLGADKRLIAPSSSLTYEQAVMVAEFFVMLDRANRAYTTAQGTGSMRPHFDSNVVLLLERVKDGGGLAVGQIAIRRGPPGESGPVHRVEELREDGWVMFHATSVYRSYRDTPDRNARGGYFFPPEDVLWRVVAPIYTKRD